MSISAVMGTTVGLISSGQRSVVIKTPVGSEATPAYDARDKLAPSTESLQMAPVNLTSNTTPASEELGKLVRDMQSKVPVASKELQFSVDQESGRSVVTLTDRSTKEVLWQVPSEVALRISKELDQFQKGALVNREA